MEILDKTMAIIESCDSNIIHEEIVSKVRKKLKKKKNLYSLSELFKVFGDFTRVKVLWALKEEEMCVCDIAALLSMTQSAISHQLRVLRNSNLVKSRKDGKVVYYSLDDGHVEQIFNQALIHVDEKLQLE